MVFGQTVRDDERNPGGSNLVECGDRDSSAPSQCKKDGTDFCAGVKSRYVENGHPTFTTESLQ